MRKQLKRDQVAAFFARLQPCLVGVEACGGAHFWAAKLTSLGHEVKMMAPQIVKPYVKTNKNDSLDAEAICEAVARPNMRFVPVTNAVVGCRIAIVDLRLATPMHMSRLCTGAPTLPAPAPAAMSH